MIAKASISLSEQQAAFARQLVEDGRFASVSEVVERGLELVREETEHGKADMAALRRLIAERRAGPTVSMDDSRREIEAMLAAKKARLGL
ncbi:type II toxin-antitoxin system ParD family antitoxin [Rhizobium sp. SG2393]|uniref:ribbon-helix-helix domain-containing protein n=1 Tax=Rhizobium sp. SG2393 TaxID=3276279 RepID=UPI00366D2D2E